MLSEQIRRAYSALEVIIALSVFGLLIGLLIQSVQKVRLKSKQAVVKNQVRSLSVAICTYGASSDDGLCKVHSMGSHQFCNVFSDILTTFEPNYGGDADDVIAFRSASDPSYEILRDELRGNSSFAANAQLFRPSKRISSVTDGLSNTISLTERYARCGRLTGEVSCTAWSVHVSCGDAGGNPYPCHSYHERPATIADTRVDDVMPLNLNAVTTPSVPGKTFQLVPDPRRCDPTIPQASFHSGLITAMADGSVRTYSAAVSANVFWSAVTPAGGETAGEP